MPAAGCRPRSVVLSKEKLGGALASVVGRGPLTGGPSFTKAVRLLGTCGTGACEGLTRRSGHVCAPYVALSLGRPGGSRPVGTSSGSDCGLHKALSLWDWLLAEGQWRCSLPDRGLKVDLRGSRRLVGGQCVSSGLCRVCHAAILVRGHQPWKVFA